MGEFQNFKFEDALPDLSPETQLNFRKFLQVAGIENMLINDGRRISDAEVLNEIRKEVAMLSKSGEERTTSLIPACMNGDDETVRALLPSGEYDVNEVAPDGETALTCAVSANALHIVELLLKHGADPNFRGKKVECTPLMEAASVGYTDIVRLLLEYGACVGQKSSTGNTALHYAATAGHLDCVRLLLQYSSPMEVQNETGHTPLMEATSNGHIDVARCLINHGCDINTHSTEFKESALTLASYKGHTEMVKFLLESGADHEHRTDEMHTALMEAAMEGHVEVARLLLAHGANVNIPQDSFESPLTLAACGGHTELALLLIGYGADIEEVNDEGYTPLMEAAREGHEETVALLLAVGADVNARTEETQETALTLAACGGFIEVCEMLLNAGSDIEVGGVGCSTPLMEAAQEGHLDLVRRLLQRGAAVNAVTATGDTALHYAAENGHVKVCEELLDWGAILDAMPEGGRTPLMKAARSGNLEVVQLFIKRGASIDQSTSQNDANALALACSGGHSKVVKYLLQHGADPQYQLRDGSTMLIEAARSGSPAVLRLILDYPRCLTQPPTTPILGNTIPQQQLQLLQQQSYQPLLNGSTSSVGNATAVPLAPLLPVTGGANVEPCLDPSHSHLHAHQHSLSCRVQHTHPSLPFQAPITGLVQPTGSSQPPTHLDAALVSAYAVGWADGAASLVQQQTQSLSSGIGESQSCAGAAVLCSSSANSIFPSSTAATFDPTSISQSLTLKALSAGINAPSFRMGSTCEPRASQLDSASLPEEFAPTFKPNLHPASSTPGHSGTTTDSVSSLSGSSSVSNGSSTSSLVAGAPVDPGDDMGAGLLQALFHELMPDKDELFRRFEAVMCPYSALRASRPSTGQQPVSGIASTATAVTMTTNAAAIALSRLVDQQQQHCCQRPAVLDMDTDVRSPQPSIQCLHSSSIDSIAISTESALEDYESTRQYQSVNVTCSRRTVDQSELFETALSGAITTSITPILSSCHSSSSALSTHECSASSSVGATDSVCLPCNLTSVALGSVSSYDFDIDKSNEVLPSVINSPYFGGVIDASLTTTQNIFHEPTIDHELLATYRHYHHPGPHLACALDATAAAAAVASLSGHPNTHSTLHHHHHPLSVSASGDGLVTPSGLLHVPHQSSAIPVGALMTNSVGALAYDPTNVLTTHSLHPSSVSATNTRILPTCPTPVLTSTGAVLPPSHVLPPADMNTLPNVSAVGDPVTPVNVPSLIDVNACIESSMETALTLACHGGYTELVRLLLERGADREHRDKKSHTPLHTAVYANQRAVVALLLDYGVDIEAQVDRTKDTALSIACSHGMLEIVEELLNRRANKEHRNISDYTPLSLAASGGHVEVIQLLLQRGAEINSRTGSKLGISPLMLASMNGHTNAVRLLLEHGSDINAHIETNRNTALTLACFQGRHPVVSLLVERKANIEHRAKTGLTPLMEAASGDYVEVGMILLDHGADVNASPVPSSRDTALTIAADKGNAKFVNLLLEKGAIVEARNKKGATPLWLASNGGHLEVVQSLIRYAADVNSQDNRKVSCLMAAFRKGHVNVVRLLVQHVTQFPSDKDCIRHIKTAVTDKELAKRCQQCREIIIAAKEKQEGEARKNANCLLEQIEQEEEERANREAMQARKRERKRMKRKAKQEKERQNKDVQSTGQTNIKETPDHFTSSALSANDHPDGLDDSSSERRISMLSDAVQHVRRNPFDGQQFTGVIPEMTGELEFTSSKSGTPHFNTVMPIKAVECSDKVPTEEIVLNGSSVLSEAVPASSYTPMPSISIPSPPRQRRVHQTSEFSDTPNSVIQQSELSAAATAEAKREKHRSKKQSHRAAKRAAAENAAFSDADRSVHDSVPVDVSCILPTLPVTSSYYAVAANGDGELNWNALIESQGAQLGHYLSNGIATSSGSETNTWTVVLPSNSTRTQRSTTQGRSTTESTEWKTSSSNSGPSKRRLSIPVSRHDIGKVIGQGGAVVSALRNMSGIQIDIESARSDEVTERMVYLKGPGDAVQRTYETIQGLLNGSIAGNDVLLMYAALKKSTTTASLAFGKTILGALNSKAIGTVTSTTPSSTATKGGGLGSRGATNKSNRRTGKSTSTSCVGAPSSSTRSSSSQPPVSLLLLNRSSSLTSKATPIVTTCANSNNNSTVLCSATTVASAASGATIMSTKVATSNSSNWCSKVLPGSTAVKGNFASVAAAGLVPHSRIGSKSVAESTTLKSLQAAGKHVPNLMSAFPVVALTTAPVSLLSLNVTPISTTSQMFPDLTLAFSALDAAPDSFDEASFPPLSSTTNRVSTAVTVLEDIESQTALASENRSTVVGNCENVEPTVVLKDKGALDSDPMSSFVRGDSVLESEIGPSSVSPAIFKPLTVSPPPVAGAHASQPPTPVGSSGSHVTTCTSTPPTTVTHVRQFARAPGSERSAHQRGGNVTSTASVVSIGDAYPPSLMSLEVNANPGITDGMLLTPTKRVVSPEPQDPEFHRPNVTSRFRTEQASEWHEPVSTSTTVSQPCIPFPKVPGFQLDSHAVIDFSSVNTTIHQPILGTSVTSNMEVSKVQLHASDPIRVSTVSSPWPLQSTDLNPNAAAFEPSAFQPPGSSTHLTSIRPVPSTGVDSTTTLLSPSVMHSTYADLSHPDSICGAYSLDSSLTGGMRHVPLKPTGSGIPLSLHQAPGGSAVFSSSSGNMLPSVFPQSATVATTTRSKPMLSVTPNSYTEPRNTLINGFPRTVSPSQQPTLVPGAQFHPMFPSATQHTVLGGGNLPNSLIQQQSTVAASRLGGGSPHPLLGQTQLAMGCASASTNSYTPPPCVPGFIQPGVPTPTANTPVGPHSCGSFSTHLLNGSGSTVSVLGGGSLIGNNTSMHQPPCVQPIGAERRRQIAAALTSNVPPPPSSGTYPVSTSNGTGPGPYGFSSSGLTNQPPAVHLQTPSSQQSSNPNLLMFMNLAQQSQLGLGSSSSSHLPSSWQAPSLWPPSTMGGSFSASANNTAVIAPGKLTSTALADPNVYNSANLLSSNLSSNSGTTRQQQQQLVAAMAAMSMCPWNSGGSTGSTMINPTLSGQNRWIYPPHGGSSYSNATPATQTYFTDQLSQSLKPPLGASHPNTPHHPQAIHRPPHE